MTKENIIKTLIKKTGCGLPEAIRIYNELTNNGFYEIERKDLTAYIKKNF